MTETDEIRIRTATGRAGHDADWPRQPSEVTAAWLTRMLRAAGKLADAQEVRDFSIRSIGDGVAMVSKVLRVELSYSDGHAAAPTSLVLKFAHEVEARRAVGVALRLFESEVTFYNRIAPFVAVPKPMCHFAAVDSRTGECIVVLEDLVRFRGGDQVTGVGSTEAKLVIDAFAPLHAAYWGNTDQDILSNTMRVDSSWRDVYLGTVHAAWERCVTQFGHCIPAIIKSSLPAYVDGFGTLHRMMADRTQTLVHGDPRVDNIMFNDGDDGNSVFLLDWQTLMITNPLHDLAMMLSMSSPTATRRSVEDHLVRYYHSKLIELGVDGYRLEQCFDDYDVAALYSLSVALVMGGAFDPANERGKRLAEDVLRRACATVVDRGLLDRISPPSA